MPLRPSFRGHFRLLNGYLELSSALSSSEKPPKSKP